MRPAIVVPDAIWPSDNQFGVPTLDLSQQATCIAAPFAAWGSVSRRSRHRGTWHFYVDDYKFSRVWDDPDAISRTRCCAVVEPNYSTGTEMPMAVALWGVYRKRWLARYWQSIGLRVIVDLNVDDQFAELNTLGVPRGWRAFATRGSLRTLESVARQFDRAAAIANGSAPLFAVYGGGADVRQWCADRHCVWMPDQGNAKRELARIKGAYG